MNLNREGKINPLVSVIIPTYNCARYITEAIESVLNQTCKDFEIIIIDDGSTDNTGNIINDYIEKNYTIKYFYQKNKGPAAARNNGLSKARGEYIAFLDSDDIWLPEFLHKLVSKIESNPETGFIYCGCLFVSAEREIIPDYIRRNYFVRGNIVLDLFCNYFLMTGSVVIRKQCLDKVGYFNEKLLVGEDYDLFLRVAYHYKADFVNENLFERRVLSNSLSRKDFKLDARNDLETLKRFVKEHADFYISHRKIISARLADYYFSFGYKCLHNGEAVLAFPLFLYSMSHKPSVRVVKNLIFCLIPHPLRRFLKEKYAKRKCYHPYL